MSHLRITGGRPLRGEIAVQGAKNSVLPILSATILCADACRIRCCPRLDDVDAAAEILQYLGCAVRWEGGDLVVDSRQMTGCHIPRYLMEKMRSSVIFLGPLLARFGEASLSYPGGCQLGPRPIDLHLKALRAMGAEIREDDGRLLCRVRHLHGTEISLPIPSVGATENILLAGCGAAGTTILSGAAREPEIEDLQSFLVRCGAQVSGAGGHTVAVVGKQPMHGCDHRCIGDRIAAATYLCAAAATGGQIGLLGVEQRHLGAVCRVLQRCGCNLRHEEGFLALRGPERLRGANIIATAPFPGFPTDAQAILMAALCRADGATMMVENLFDSRFRHVPELRRMGAHIRCQGRTAVVYGVDALHGAEMHATDLRGGAALVVAALQAEEPSAIYEIHHIQRGYEDIARDIRALGGHIDFVADG